MNAADWMTIFSATTLVSWLAAGIVGLFGVQEQLRRPVATHAIDLAMASLMIIGMISIIAMIVASVF